MHKNSNIFILGMFFLLNFTSVFAQVPEWAKTNQHKKYPSSNFFLGVGIADNKTEAIELARADVAKQIRVKIESELETIESEFREGDKGYITSEVKSQTKSVVSETIAGIEIAKVKKVKGKYYILAVLNKSKYLSGIEVEMGEILTETEQLVGSARKLSSEGKIFASVENYIDAQNCIPEFYTKGALYTALSGKKYPVIEQFTGPGILAEMRDLFSHIELTAVSGENQKGKSGTVLSMPLVVKVFYESETREKIGVDRFPVLAKYDNGELIAKKETNSDGFAEFRVVAVPTDDIGKNGAVIISLNMARLPDIFKDLISKSEIFIHYFFEIEPLDFFIHIVDKSGSRYKNIEDKFAGLVSENGYSVSDDAPFVIEGNVAVFNEKEIDSPMGKQFYVESVVKLSLIDRSDGKTIASFKAKGKGLNEGSRQAAVEKSHKNLKISKKKFAAFLQSAAN
ncbi:MAG: LPP20 family lipoprotein [Candidatus Marinimicrobia bacterium]|nr:LPP20 family lipoprotein [Candidatus Neomarinimicrobiota bacterium]